MKRKHSGNELASVMVFWAAILLPLTAWTIETDVEILEADESGLTLDCTIPEVLIRQVKTAEGSWRSVDLEGWAHSDMPGTPRLPRTAVLMQIPRKAHAVVRLLEGHTAEKAVQDVIPVPLREGALAIGVEQHPSERHVPDKTVYDTNALYPSDPTQLEAPAILRGISVQRLLIHPVQWNPVTGRMLYYRRMRLRVDFVDSVPEWDAQTTLRPSAAIPTRLKNGPFESALQKLVVNYRTFPEEATAPDAVPASPSVAGSVAPDSARWARLKVEQAGLYRVYLWDLAQAGAEIAGMQANTLRLLNRGNEVAAKVVSADPGNVRLWDYVEFYAESVDNQFTGTNIFWLNWGQEQGIRISTRDTTVTGEGTKVNSSRHRVRAEENEHFWLATPGAPEEDYIFWGYAYGGGSSEYPVYLPSPVPDAPEAELRAMFQGVSSMPQAPDHHTRLHVNGTLVSSDDEFWDGVTAHLQEAEFPVQLLHEGENVVRLESPGDTGTSSDVVYHNWIEIDYERFLNAEDDRLMFSLEGKGVKEVKTRGFSDPAIRIYDISNPLQARELQGFTVDEGEEGLYAATFQDDLFDSCTYAVASQAGTQRLNALTIVTDPEALKDTGQGADYIVVTHDAFIPSLEPLVAHREAQGLRVRTVGVQSIYDAFSFGLSTPEAIRTFLSYAYRNWQAPAPSHVLLAGDATTDYRDYNGTGKKSLVPTWLSVVSLTGLTPDDNAFVCLDGDDPLPEMTIGRISGETAEALVASIAKILTYEEQQTLPPKQALFVSDDDDVAFESLNENVIAMLPRAIDPERVYLSDFPGLSNARQELLSQWLNGVMLVNYVGHGTTRQWASSTFFHVDHVALLENPPWLPLVTTMTCLDGYFASAFGPCLCEALVAQPNRGAIAAFCPSGMGYTLDHSILAEELFGLIFGQGTVVLGEVTTQAKIAAYARGVPDYILQTFTLLGDPAMHLKSWQ